MALMAGALCVLLAGATAVIAAWEPTTPEDVGLDPGTPLVEVRDMGAEGIKFNPASCQVARNSRLYFVNQTDEPQTVAWDSNFSDWDTGVMQPGETGKPLSINAVFSEEFYLESDEGVRVTVFSTNQAPGTTNCAPAGPTPTPTPTPTATPTPTVTPTPSPTLEPTATPQANPTPEGRKGLVPEMAREVEHQP